MIQTGFESRIKIQDIISNQIPEFTLDESPKFSEFLKQYYISQEYQGAPVDIVENLDQYKKVDNLIPEVIIGSTTLTAGITSTTTNILVNNTKGYPQRYGLLKIDNEIITYTNKTSTSFTGCVRGFSGITSYHANLNDQELIFSTSTATSHSNSSQVKNLSALFLQEFYKKTKYSLTPELENLDFTPNLNVGNFIKASRILYESKGTDESFRILFNVLYGETVKVIDLEQFLLKPSSATYLRREVAVAEAISGDPLKLSGQTIVKNTDSNSTASVSEVEIIRRGGKTYYKLFLFVGYDDAFPTVTGTFNITGSTKNIEPVSVGGSIITVDSTIGFAPSGKIYSGINTISYTSKSINQFFGCSGITSAISTASVIRSDEIYYGYENGDISKKVQLRLTGVLSNYVPTLQNSTIEVDEKISVKNVGENIKNPVTNKSYKEIFANSWIYNTSSRYQIDTFVPNQPTTILILKSEIDKSSLKVGDTIEILNRESQTIVESNLVVTQITNKQITTNNSFTLNQSFNYDVRRKLKKSNSSSVGLEFNSITADIQNVYNENDNYMYVASNSLPSYTITKSLLTYDAVGIVTTVDYNLNTNTYSTIKFSTPVSFFSGSEIYYNPSISPILGLSKGIYYVQVIGTDKIRLYNSRSVVGTDNYVKLQASSLTGSLPTGTHNFSLNSQKEKKLSPQKILRKFPLFPNIGDGKSDLTEPGYIGLLINGVEISSYKTTDRIYYGPISSVKVLNEGKDYDVINPPLIGISTGAALIQPVIMGSIKKIFVDPQDFNVDVVVSVNLTGGNGSGASFEPVLEIKNREIEFDAREIIDGGGIDINVETITFLSNHNLIDGQPIIYNSRNNPSIGISTFNGLNTDSGQTLNNGTTYYAKYISDTTIQLYKSITDYQSGINTVGFTTIGTAGVQEFLTEPKKSLSTIKVINGGTGYTNRKLIILPVGVSTTNNILYFPNHGFKDGEKVVYSNTGVTTTSSSSPISGISTLNQYYILKEDENNFRLANAGIGGTIVSNYERRKYISIGSTGIGYHIFNYPPISLTVDYSAVGLGSTQYKGIINAVPDVKGKIIDAYVYNVGAGYGSTILNYHNKPSIQIKNGKYATFIPVVVGGKLKKVTVQYKGSEYYSTPDLVVSGVGTGAILRPVVENGRVTNVIVINPGIGYSQQNTTVTAIPSGKGALLDVQIRSLSIDNNRLYDDVNDTSLLANEIIKESNYNLQYSISGYLGSLQNSFGDNGLTHSPIIGWAYDGNPIYGSYGYTDPKNFNSAIKRLVSGYTANQNNIVDRPAGFDLKFFVEDYKFTNSGDLDEYNGRFCITPEFPNGIYAYFATSVIDNNGNNVGSFPYFIGDRYRSKFIRENKILNQNFDFNKSELIRNTFPYKVSDEYANNDFLIESNEIINQLCVVESVTTGPIDNFTIVKSGFNYKKNDEVQFDESSSGGSGLIVRVSEVNGKDISKLESTITSYDDSIFTWRNGNQIQVKTPVNHALSNNDYVTISGFSTSLSSLNGFYQVEVKSVSTSLASTISNYSSTGIVTDIYVSSIPNEVSIGTTIKINDETLSVLNIFKYQNVIRVSRNTSGGIHTSSTPVYFNPDSFVINKTVKSFESKINDIVYFNPKLSVGVGTTTGGGINVNYRIGISTNRNVFIPTQAIYLPNHSFKTSEKIILKKPGAASVISVANSPTSSPFNLLGTGNIETVYAINKSKDYIGIVTQIGLTTTSQGLYFISNGTDDFQYSFSSDYKQIKGDVKNIVSNISISTSHQLKSGDQIKLSILPNLSVGIGTSTSVKVLYDSINEKLIVNPLSFTTSGINTIKDEITIQNHGLFRGQKLIYSASTVASGLSTGFYYVYKVTDDKIKLCETLKDCISEDPLFVNILAANGSNHKLSQINPPLQSIKNNNLVFDLSDSSLSGYKFKIFYDQDFKDEFVSTGSTSTFTISGVGTVGVSTNASLTIKYSNTIPSPLFYGLEKLGLVINADKEITNYSQINFVNSIYNGSYIISGVGTTTFSVSLSKIPEKYSYIQSECKELRYTTSSLTASGGISKLTVISSGSNFKSLPIFKNISSLNGNGAYIVPKSSIIGRVNKVRIVNEGFEYSSDKTLKPESEVSKFLQIDNANTLLTVNIDYGGKNYTSAPNLVIVNPNTGTIIDSGILTPIVNGTSISRVIINPNPSGLPEASVKIRAINNTNGIGIQTVYSSASSGIITCILITPLNGFSPEPFAQNDDIFVEGIKKYGSNGNGFNSSDYGYNFFKVKQYLNAGTQSPRQIEFEVPSSNPGIADTVLGGLYGNIVNYKNYPVFTSVQEFSNFIPGEFLQVKNQLGFFVAVNLKVINSNKNYIKVSGSYIIEKNQTIRGSQSGITATVIQIDESTGQFTISYSSVKNLGWSDDTGKLDTDTQVIPDNDYYQNLAYSLKSNQRWETIVSSVNKLLHTSGLKNFADTQIIKTVGAGVTIVSKEYADLLYSFINENRVDAINNFDRVIDFDSDGQSSKFLKFLTKKLASYIECRTNRVLEIDDISSQFAGVSTANSFELNYLQTPIFVKTFNPSNSNVLNLSTGEFTIANHFFNTGEELTYSPNSISSVGIGLTLNYVGVVTNILPTIVYAIKTDNTKFKLATRKEYANLGIAVTFTSVGVGTTHTLEMNQKSSKSIISINNIVQSPLAFSLLSYTVDNGGQIGLGSTIFGLSGISSIFLGDILKIDNEYMKVVNVGLGTTLSGPISFGGTFSLVSVDRAFVGTSATSHANSSPVYLYRGSFNIVRNKIHFTDSPRGMTTSQYYTNTFGLPEPSSTFNGRVFLRKNYESNQIFDNISEKFTGIGQTYTLTSNGINTVGLGSTGGNGIVFLNGIFQTPTTKNNSDNNYSIIENNSVGISSIVFTGITSSSGSLFVSVDDVNLNQLPRGGMIISLGSTPGLGYAPLVGAAVTAVVGAGGSIVSIGVGTITGFNGNFGSGYRSPVSIAVTEVGHVGTAATINATVGAGGTLSFSIVGGGTGYTTPTINVSSPGYNNLPVTGVSRLGVGATTTTGTGLLLNIEVGASSTTGIGSTLFEVTGFKISRSGYGFKKGDVITPVGLVTAFGLTSPVSQFELTVLDTFTDSFSAWQFGEMDYIDSIKQYQDGVRTRFPLYYNSQLISFEKNSLDADSQLIDFKSLLIIFINGILQDPGYAYDFNGGTSFTFNQPPKPEDNVAIFFYRGSDADSSQKSIFETIKIGDTVQAFSNNNHLGFTTTQNPREVFDIVSSDTIQTNNYLEQGINLQVTKPSNLTWIKQKKDKIISGQIVYKSRDVNEPQVYPTAKIIRNVSTSDNEIFVDDSSLFLYDSPIKFDSIIVSGDLDSVHASITPVVSSSGTIQSLTIVNGGSGYTGATANVKISNPERKSAVAVSNISIVSTGATIGIVSTGIVTGVSVSYGGYLYTSAPLVKFENPPSIGVGIGTTATGTANLSNGIVTSVTITNPGYGYNFAPAVTFSAPGINTATATATISNGQVTSITITNPGFGYTTTNLPDVIIPVQKVVYENIKSITGVAGSFGNITGISTAVGINTNLAIKFTLNPSPLSLSVGYPIYIYDTSVGSGVTSLDNYANKVGIGTTFLNNIYYVSAFNSGLGIATCDIVNTSSVVGIATTGISVGKFSWGRIFNSTRSSSPISLTVSGYYVDAGLSTFPTIQRRSSGLRNVGPLKKVL